MTAAIEGADVVSILHQTATQYARNGIHIFPCAPSGKHPATHRGFKDATTDIPTVDAWWRDNPNYNIGIACGATGIFIVDVDGPQAAQALDQLEQEHGPLPDTYSITTGREDGGTHLTFRQPTGQPVGNRQIGAGGKLETRGAGGYVIAPPSVHPTGARYTANGKWSDIADPPDWLVDLCTKPTTTATDIDLPTRPTDDGERSALSIAGRVAMGTEGNRNKLLYWAACKIGGLIAAGRLKEQYGRHLLEGAAQRAGLEEREIQATIRSGFETGFEEPDYGTGTSYDTPPAVTVLNDQPQPTDETEDAFAEIDRLYPPLNFAELWDQGIDDVDWIVPGIFECGRSYALYAPAKTGKSLVMLELAICVANGLPFADIDIEQPRSVLYVDAEMTPGDVIARIKDMGFGPDDLDNLHYLSLPSLPPLDIEEGGRHIAAVAKRWQADLIIFDTASRVVEGPENDADTWRAFYAHTGQRLKAAGHCAVRLDHAGKNASRGQRGSSAKNDDVDGVWKIGRSGDVLELIPEQQRTANVLDEPLTVTRDHHTGRLAPVYEKVALTDDQEKVVRQLDDLKVPDRCTNKQARDALREAGHSARNEDIAKAVKRRKSRPQVTVLGGTQ